MGGSVDVELTGWTHALAMTLPCQNKVVYALDLNPGLCAGMAPQAGSAVLFRLITKSCQDELVLIPWAIGLWLYYGDFCVSDSAMAGLKRRGLVVGPSVLSEAWPLE